MRSFCILQPSVSSSPGGFFLPFPINKDRRYAPSQLCAVCRVRLRRDRALARSANRIRADQHLLVSPLGDLGVNIKGRETFNPPNPPIFKKGIKYKKQIENFSRTQTYRPTDLHDKNISLINYYNYLYINIIYYIISLQSCRSLLLGCCFLQVAVGRLKKISFSLFFQLVDHEPTE